MFNFLKRKKEEKSEQFEQKFNHINESLNTSFHHVKTDINQVHSWMKDLENHHTNHYKKFQEYDKKIIEIEQKISQLSSLIKVPESAKIEEKLTTIEDFKKEEINKSLWSNLTETKKNFFYTIYIMIQESGVDLVPMKSLTEELYPTKSYHEVKSMISSYTENLQDLGFLKKSRKGREIFISLTPRAKEFLPKKTLKNQIKVKKN